MSLLPPHTAPSRNGKTGKTRGQLEIEVRDREALALRLRREGHDYGEIAQQVGWRSESTARDAVQRALRRRVEPDVEVLRNIEDDKLAEMERVCWAIIRADHWAYSWGKPVLDEHGNRMQDPEPRLKAINTLVRLQERRARLFGLDAAAKRMIGVVSGEMVEESIADLDAQAAALLADLPDDVVEAELLEDD